jgi:hypothetical protein
MNTRPFRTFLSSAILGAALVRGVEAQTSSVTLLDYRTTVPAGWVARAPSSSSRLAQFVLSGSDSANGAEVVVFFFGQDAGRQRRGELGPVERSILHD